jgi:arabinan endo-1,5-alpha-L-arabinosidase
MSAAFDSGNLLSNVRAFLNAHVPGDTIGWLATAGQQGYLDLHARIADALGTRLPRNRAPQAAPAFTAPCQPLLTEPLSSDILYGYGDPAVLHVPEEGAWYMVVTSNDAPHSFPILRTANLQDWEQRGFVFPKGSKPAWAKDGPEVSDYWAPELHRVNGEYWVCFSARGHDDSFSLGLARAARPEGPYCTAPEPLLRGGLIDAHLFIEKDGRSILFWKEDSNGIWPRLLVGMIAGDPSLCDRLFDTAEDRRTANLAGALWLIGGDLPPMQQFFLLQPLIEAVIDHFGAVRERLAALGTNEAAHVLETMRTPIFAQRLSRDGAAFTGERHVVLVNDLLWEGHLIEGPWVTEQDGRFYLFYAGNDFSTHEYGIGVAVGESPFGPYRKVDEPVLRSTAHWSGPGHPSVAPAWGGKPHLFYHAFFPGQAGYKEFRALLTTGLHFHPDGVNLI